MNYTSSLELSKPRTIIFDIEVSPHEGQFWGKKWDTNVVGITHYGQILCFGAKWLGQKTEVIGWPDFKRDKEYNVVKRLREYLDEADLVIGQNHKDFDIKFRRVALHANEIRWRPPVTQQPVQVISELPEDMKNFVVQN